MQVGQCSQVPRGGKLSKVTDFFFSSGSTAFFLLLLRATCSLISQFTSKQHTTFGMATATTTQTFAPNANIGVYTNPQHDLWVAEALPKGENVESGEDLLPGELTIAIKSTGICG